MGGIVAVIAWLVIVGFAAQQIPCVEYSTCKSDDLMGFAILAVIMFPASCLAGFIVSFFDRNPDESDK
jgi:hypothetical protein